MHGLGVQEAGCGARVKGAGTPQPAKVQEAGCGARVGGAKVQEAGCGTGFSNQAPTL